MITLIKGLIKQHLLLVIIFIGLAIYYPELTNNYKNYFNEFSTIEPTTPEHSTKETLFTKDILAEFNGESKKEIYLSILGSVYDVTKGVKHYGKGCAYNFFAGRDASVEFITGEFVEFTEGSDDVLTLKPSDLLGLDNWKKFYDKEYIYKGKLIGRFYDETGAKTNYHLQLDEMIKIAEDEKEEESVKMDQFPMCNIEWSESLGTKVWCSNRSGGKERNWTGVPRKFFEPGKSYRCACVKEEDLNSPHLEQYENCDPNSDTCFYRVD